MLRTSLKSCVALAAGVMAMGMAGSACADAAATVGIQAKIAGLNDLIARKPTAKEFADYFYEDDLNLVVEGEKAMYPDLKSFMKPLEGYIQNPTCRFRLVGKVRQSGNLAAAWTEAHCEARGQDPGGNFRILYVFRHGAKGWRATMEIGGPGSFGIQNGAAR